MRLWLLVLSDPAIIYSSNPSTLAVFLEEIKHDWTGSTRLLRESAAHPSALGPEIRRIASRVLAFGWRRRVARVAGAVEPLPLVDLVPALRCYCTWDGGQVGPFLDMLRAKLPPARLRHVPMYSMSTECLQTQSCLVGDTLHYLPMTPGILYEFLPEGAAGTAANLLGPAALEIGRSYAMVVRDPWGFRRYSTDDLFRCVGRVGSLPDLRFQQRCGLAYSFTGEILTGRQVEATFEEVCSSTPALGEAGLQLCLVPALGEGVGAPGLPHYRLVMAHVAARPPAVAAAAVAASLDRALARQNQEFAAKQASGRLGATRALFSPMIDSPGS